MEIIKSFWEGMTNVCACVYMVDMCLHMERGTHRGNCFNIASRPREEKRKAIKAPWQEMILKIKFSVSGKLELKSEGGVIYTLTYNSGGRDRSPSLVISNLILSMTLEVERFSFLS